MTDRPQEKDTIAFVPGEIADHPDARAFLARLGVGGNSAELDDQARLILAGTIEPEALRAERQREVAGHVVRLEFEPDYWFDN